MFSSVCLCSAPVALNPVELAVELGEEDNLMPPPSQLNSHSIQYSFAVRLVGVLYKRRYSKIGTVRVCGHNTLNNLDSVMITVVRVEITVVVTAVMLSYFKAYCLMIMCDN